MDLHCPSLAPIVETIYREFRAMTKSNFGEAGTKLNHEAPKDTTLRVLVCFERAEQRKTSFLLKSNGVPGVEDAV